MKRLLGILAGGLLAAAFTLPSSPAKAASVPFASGLSIAMITPSMLTTSYDYYNVTVAERGASSSDCGFKLYFVATGPGAPQQQPVFLGDFRGTSTKVQLSPYNEWVMAFEAYPYDCSGNVGAEVQSTEILPMVYEIDVPAPWLYSGAGHEIVGSIYAGGAAMETTSKGAEFLWNTDCNLNQALVIGTGPQGGIGTVTVGGPGLTTVNKGTINFYSATAKGRLIAFKYGVPGPYGQYQWIKVVETKAGKQGGVQMYFNAAIEDQAPFGCFN